MCLCAIDTGRSGPQPRLDARALVTSDIDEAMTGGAIAKAKKMENGVDSTMTASEVGSIICPNKSTFLSVLSQEIIAITSANKPSSNPEFILQQGTLMLATS